MPTTQNWRERGDGGELGEFSPRSLRSPRCSTSQIFLAIARLMERTGLEPASTNSNFQENALPYYPQVDKIDLPGSRWELPPSRTLNSFQCFCNPLPIFRFGERRDATFYPTPSNLVVLVGAGFQLFSGAIPIRRPPHVFIVASPPGRYCPFCPRVISTVPRFLASGG